MALLVGACSSSTASTGPGASGADGAACKTGKNAPFAAPAGTPFTLPTGVTLEGGEMTGDVQQNCGDQSFVEYGSDLISVCVGLRNTTGADITVTIPAGTVFLVKDPAGQNGIILQSHDLQVPAGQVAYFYFRPFCINEHCIYGRKEDRYTFGNVASDPKIAELIALAKTKSLKPDSDALVAFGPSVWDITDGDGLTAEHRAQIAMLPNQ